jgi:redox-sensitive bicupin YhaK (pirin superfamily)
VSVQPVYEPRCLDRSGAIELAIEPRTRSLGEFDVRRVLPSVQRRMVGPFIFFDHMGPAVFPPGKGIAVRPHPHIGLATVTYLFEGEIIHRDSLKFVQPIRAGALNLMTAGSGIVHSERAGDDLATASRLHGIQSWTALPTELEETAPSFVHHPADSIPQVALGATIVRVILGSAFGKTSPARVLSPTLYLEVRLPQGASFTLPDGYSERAAYVVSGGVRCGDTVYREGVMAIARSRAAVHLTASADAILMIIGGEPVGPRHIWWNFVASSQERIEQAKRDWRENRFGKVPGDDEFIPLPD